MSHAGDDLINDEVFAWVAQLLTGARRVLEVGCGRGELARRLGAAGWDVTALDLSLADPTPAPGVTWIERDFLGHRDDDGYDAVLFTSSFHHISPIERAIARAHELVRPGGRLLLDEFDRLAIDRETARWYYEAQSLVVEDPCAQWHADHEHHDHPPLHTGAEMIAAVTTRFGSVEVSRGPYLARYRGAAHARDVEHRRVADGTLAAVGLRIIAHRAP